MAILTRDQNASAPNSNVTDELLYVNPAIASSVEEIEMNIAEDGMDFIFDMLSDLSSNRGAYALREAYSNAYDATVLAGDMSRPIEISIMSTEDSDSCGIAAALAKQSNLLGAVKMFAAVTDHGIGMSTEDVKKYFTQYGGSKKRGGTSTIGSKGLGSKAPLACSDVFMVESTKDGITTYATIERKSGRNSATVRFEETGKDSGTTITIPVTDEHVYKQMRECAENIVKWNLDATIVYNGKVAAPTFVEEANGSSLVVDGEKFDYIYLGEVPVAEGENGEIVTFRMWERSNIFPSASVDSLDLNLAGTRYELCSSWGCRAAGLIVAGEPGYLNFTPSRDEVKDDEAKYAFIDAVKSGIAAIDFGPTVEDMMSKMDAYAMRDWLFDRRGTKVADNGDGTVSITYTGSSVPMNVSASMFVKDGTDYLPLFVENSKEFCGNVHIVVTQMNNDRSEMRCAHPATFGRDGWGEEARKKAVKRIELSRIAKKDLGNLGCCLIEPHLAFKMMRSNKIANSDAYYPTRIDKMVVLTDFDEEAWKSFANKERNLRRAYDCDGTILFVLTADSELSPLDKIALAGIDDTITSTFADAMALAKSVKNVGTPAAEEEFSKVFAYRYRKAERLVFQVGHGKSFYKFDDDDSWATLRDNTSYQVDFSTISSWEDFANQVVVCLYDANAHEFYSQTKLAVATIVEGMVNTGALPPSINQVLFTNKMTLTDARAFAAAGGKFFADERKQCFGEAPMLLDSTCGLKAVRSYSGRIEAFEVAPSLVMDGSALGTFDASQELRRRIANDRANAADVYAMCLLLDEEKFPVAAQVRELVASALNKNEKRSRRIISFTNEEGSEASNLERSYNAVMAATSEIFSEIGLDRFYDLCYDCNTGAMEIHFKKNAEALLTSAVNDMAEKLL